MTPDNEEPTEDTAVIRKVHNFGEKIHDYVLYDYEVKDDSFLYKNHLATLIILISTNRRRLEKINNSRKK